jgi:nucleotide-binding universal stress UspA family protein
MFNKILVGYDGSNAGREALEEAASLARVLKAQVTALWVREPLPKHSDLPGEYEAEEEAAEEYFKGRSLEVQEMAKQKGTPISCETSRGHPAKAILQFAEEGQFDLIVVGHSDHSGLWGRLLGDTANRISDQAHCSVLIIKRRAKD